LIHSSSPLLVHSFVRSFLLLLLLAVFKRFAVESEVDDSKGEMKIVLLSFHSQTHTHTHTHTNFSTMMMMMLLLLLLLLLLPPLVW